MASLEVPIADTMPFFAGGNMNISVTHTTEVQGHGIQVQVNAEAGEAIAGVRTGYDSFPIW